MDSGYARATQVVRKDAIQQVEAYRDRWRNDRGFNYDVEAWSGEDSEGDRVLTALIEHLNEWAGIDG